MIPVAHSLASLAIVSSTSSSVTTKGTAGFSDISEISLISFFSRRFLKTSLLAALIPYLVNALIAFSLPPIFPLYSSE